MFYFRYFSDVPSSKSDLKLDIFFVNLILHIIIAPNSCTSKLILINILNQICMNKKNFLPCLKHSIYIFFKASYSINEMQDFDNIKSKFVACHKNIQTM